MALTYWERRAVRRALAAQQREDEALRTIRKATQSALTEIQAAIDRIGGSFRRTYDLTEAEAQALLEEPADRAEYERLLREIAAMPDGREKQRMQARAASGGYAYRISREEAMRAHVEAQAVILGGKTEQALKSALEDTGVAEATGLREDLMTAGAGIDFAGDTLGEVREIIRTPWNGGDYSSRVWTNTQALRKLLNETITGGVLAGRSGRDMASDIAKVMNVSYYQAERLVRTEGNRIQNASALKALRDAGETEYRWSAALDKRTCEACGELDRKVFKIADAAISDTLPPKHPFCRCNITPVVEPVEGRTRFARDSAGNGTKVPAGMTWEQWKAGVSADEKAAVLRSFNALAETRKQELTDNPLLALPNAATVTVDDRKFTEYLFGGTIKAGLDKGVAFKSRLDYNNSNWELLRDEILQAAKEYPAKQATTDRYGTRYSQEIVLDGLKGTPANAILGWIVNATRTKMTTVYITEVRKNGR